MSNKKQKPPLGEKATKQVLLKMTPAMYEKVDLFCRMKDTSKTDFFLSDVNEKIEKGIKQSSYNLPPQNIDSIPGDQRPQKAVMVMYLTTLRSDLPKKVPPQ